MKPIRDKGMVRTELDRMTDHWSQETLAECNGQLLKIAKGIGALSWHQHDNQDELFFIQKGSMRIQLESGDGTLEAGDMFVVPRGIQHAPVAEEEAEFMIVGL